MKHALVFAISLLLLVTVVGQASSQGMRRPQVELYAGAGIPRSPEGFKTYYKVGISINGQYVIFPQPNVGITIGGGYEMFTFDDKKFLDDLETAWGVDLTGLDVSGSASILELGVGVRPYLTPQVAPTQIFLFGMGTLNVLKTETQASYGGSSASGSESETVPGVAGGAGIEMPAGQSVNLVIQGIFKFVFGDKVTGGETLSFLGVTAGVVF
jgi:hypothetical protein